MRTIKTTTGVEIALDGDLLAIMETLYREVTARRELERSFEDMIREIKHLIDQMDDDERRAYLLESLFLNTVKDENDKLEAYMRKIADSSAALLAVYASAMWRDRCCSIRGTIGDRCAGRSLRLIPASC